MNTVFWNKLFFFLCIKFYSMISYFKQKCSNFCSILYVIEQNLGYSKGWTNSSWFKGMLLNWTLFGIARSFYYQEIRFSNLLCHRLNSRIVKGNREYPLRSKRMEVIRISKWNEWKYGILYFCYNVVLLRWFNNYFTWLSMRIISKSRNFV